MPELLLHYIWLQRVFDAFPQYTTDGKLIEVLNVGKHNLHAGPDFFNVQLRIDGMLWVGNVEIHISASDWKRHGHHLDPAYDNVILHVVKRSDKEVFNSKGERIPQCELVYPKVENQLERILVDRISLCNQRIAENPSLLQDDWKRFLLQERMSKKTDAIGQLLALSHNHWEEAFYVTLAHNFGFHTNGLPFEMMARQTPLAYLLKHRDNLFQIEAMLFGQAGLLAEQTATDSYTRSLLQEYRFLQTKFGLMPIEGSLWKMLRMRPTNFPHVRIAQFAALLHQSEALFSKAVDTDDLSLLRGLFAVRASDYWTTHYRFGAVCTEEEKRLGRSAVDVLIINSVVPYQYAYAKAQGQVDKQNAALDLLQRIPAESNSVVQQWKILGLTVRSAADSQTYLQLYQNYCLEHRCTACDVGYQIFTQN